LVDFEALQVGHRENERGTSRRDIEAFSPLLAEPAGAWCACGWRKSEILILRVAEKILRVVEK